MYDGRTDRRAAAGGVRDLVVELGAGAVEGSRAAAALTAALPQRSDARQLPVRQTDRPPIALDEVAEQIEAAFRAAVVFTHEDKGQDASTDSSLRTDPDHLHPAVQSALFDRERGLLGDRDLYTHQVSAIRAAFAGHDVVIETETASGKTLCYQVPILSELCTEPAATALYLAPTNALVEDQLEAVRRFGDCAPAPPGCEAFVAPIRLCDSLVTVARYDGGVEWKYERPKIRNAAPRFLITNPDMLSRGIVPLHERYWARFFSGLRFVVLDEMHTYRGLFGSHVANVLRRLNRIAAGYGARPQVIACSASIGNPEDLFERLVGRSPVLIASRQSGAARPRRRTIVVDTTALGRESDQVVQSTADLVAWLTARDDAPTIAFMRSIRDVDAVHGRAGQRLGEAGAPSKVRRSIRTYKREIPADQKARIIKDLRSGSARAVVATTALQMGIDIGALSVAVIGGFPGRLAALKQSAGRAGRAGGALTVVLLGAGALDQHYVRNPEDLVRGNAELVFVDPDNEDVVRRHMLAAAVERPLDASDHETFRPSTVELMEDLRAEGELFARPDNLLIPAPHNVDCAKNLDIRTTIGFDCIVCDEHGTEVARPDATRALRYYHRGARFLIEGRAYVVESFQGSPDPSGESG